MPTPIISTFGDVATEWDTLAQAKWAELRAAKGHFISKHSPQWTMAEDSRRRQEVRREMMTWAEKWFLERGHRVRCFPVTGSHDDFKIAKATQSA